MAHAHPLPPEALADWPAFWEQYRQDRTPHELGCIDRQELVLASYAKLGALKASCEAIDRTYEMADWWIKHDVHHFRRRLAVAREQYTSSLEVLMHSRLTDPRGNRGSDVLLMFNLKSRRPEVYRELPVILGSTQSRDLLDRLTAMAGADIARRTTVEPAQTVEAQVRELLPPRVDGGKA